MKKDDIMGGKKMKFTHFKSSYPSADGIHKIQFGVYFPTGQVRGIIQVSHGMCDYFERYRELAWYFTQRGFIVCGNDHLGHGNSVESDEEYGWFSEKDGWENAVNDLFMLTRIMKKSYPDLPYILIGHSMGSFLARAYATKCGKLIDGLVLLGTSGGMDAIPELLAFVDMLKKIHGGKYRSKIINKLAFGSYNSKITERRNDYDWVSRDNDVTDDFCNDKKCNFIFTLNGFENLLKVLWYVSNDKWYETFPKKLPVYLLSGSEDPVGNYGKGVLKVYNKLTEQNVSADMKIYDGARHELFTDTEKETVFEDIARFVEKTTENKD